MYTTYYATKNKEYSIINGDSYYLIDYYIKELNIAIEFNGNYWHGNPTIYNSGEFIKFPNNKNIIVDELWERDNIKISFLNSIGIKTIIIWESDMKSLNIETFLKQNKILNN